MQASQSNCSRLADFLKIHTDIYATPVYLYFKGKKKVSSGIGLIATWIAVFLMLAFIIYKGLILIEKTSYSTQMATILRPLNYSNPEVVQLNEYGFDFAYKTITPFGLEYGEVKVTRLTMQKDLNGDGESKVESLKLEIIPCGEDGFNHTDKEEIKLKEVDTTYNCVKNKSQLAVGGTFRSAFYSYIDIALVPCVNGTDSGIVCKSQEEIDQRLGNEYISLLVSNYYFDKEDNDNPIKSYIDDSIYFTIVPGQKTQADIYVSISEAQISSSLLPWAASHDHKFTLLKRITQHQATPAFFTGDSQYIRLVIKQDFWADIYEKKIYSSTDFISEVGGMFNSVYGMGKLLVLLFLDSLIVKKVISELYSSALPSTNLDQDDTHKLKERKKLSSLSDTLDAIQSRRPLFLPQYLIIQKYLSRCLCRGQTTSANSVGSSNRMFKLFQKGRYKLKTEFDIISLFRMMREFKTIKRILFKQRELLLLQLQKDQVLDSQASDAEDETFNIINGRVEKKFNSNPLLNLSDIHQIGQELEQIKRKDIQDIRTQALFQGIIQKRIPNTFEKISQRKCQRQKSSKLHNYVDQSSRQRLIELEEDNISNECENIQNKNVLPVVAPRSKSNLKQSSKQKKGDSKLAKKMKKQE